MLSRLMPAVQALTRIRLLLCWGGLFSAWGGVKAVSPVCSEPVGFIKVHVSASTPAGPALGALGVPFQRPSVFQGSVAAVGFDSIQCATDGWVPGQFAASPHFAKLRSGPGAGRVFLVTANTTDTLTVQRPVETVLASVVQKNAVLEVFPAHTLASLFGSGPAALLQSGKSEEEADLVRLHDGTSWTSYFHDGTGWRNGGSASSQDKVMLSPEQGFLIVRRARQPLSLPLGGAVAIRSELSSLPGSGEALVAHRWPFDSKLQALNLHQIGGWRSSPAAAQADKVLIWNGTSWSAFYHSGARWEKAGSFASQDNTTIPKTSALLVRRVGVSAGSLWSSPVPFAYP